MGLKYVPSPRTILLCDYSKGGFVPPEMVKKRPAIVISPRLPHRNNLCAVVPLSTTAPIKELSYVVELELEQPLPHPFDNQTVWVKCDMLATVSLDRLHMFQTKRQANGRRKYIQPKLATDDFEAIKSGILKALGW